MIASLATLKLKIAKRLSEYIESNSDVKQMNQENKMLELDATISANLIGTGPIYQINIVLNSFQYQNIDWPQLYICTTTGPQNSEDEYQYIEIFNPVIKIPYLLKNEHYTFGIKLKLVEPKSGNYSAKVSVLKNETSLCNFDIPIEFKEPKSMNIQILGFKVRFRISFQVPNECVVKFDNIQLFPYRRIGYPTITFIIDLLNNFYEDIRAHRHPITNISGAIESKVEELFARPTEQIVVYREKSEIKLNCEICEFLNEKATIQWVKVDKLENEKIYNNFQYNVDKGTLNIKNPTNGAYMCLINLKIDDYSIYTIASYKFITRKAFLNTFKLKSKIYINIYENHPVYFKCEAPLNYPNGPIYWSTIDETGFLKPVILDDRKSIDYEGNLHISAVSKLDVKIGINEKIVNQDYIGSATYTCIVKNLILRSFVMGNDNILVLKKGNQPNVLDENPNNNTKNVTTPKESTSIGFVLLPGLSWWSRNDLVVIKPIPAILECYFYGQPFPEIQWILPFDDESIVKFSHKSQQLLVQTEKIDISGDYKCIGKNKYGVASQTIKVTLEYPPIIEKMSKQYHFGVENNENVIIYFDSKPLPVCKWYFNFYKPISFRECSPNKTEDTNIYFTQNINQTTLYLTNLTYINRGAYQFNCSNSHGYSYENVLVNIRSFAPYFIEKPDKIIKIALGYDLHIKASIKSAPLAFYCWILPNIKSCKLNDQLNANLYNYHENTSFGNAKLIIKDVHFSDAGYYTIIAKNVKGTLEQTIKVIVLKNTRILEYPQSKIIKIATSLFNRKPRSIDNELNIRCRSASDPKEIRNLYTQILKEGKIISSKKGDLIELRYKNLYHTMTGNYSCFATNMVDTDFVPFEIIIRDVPSSPSKPIISHCSSQVVLQYYLLNSSLLYSPQSFEPITKLEIFYKTSFIERRLLEPTTLAKVPLDGICKNTSIYTFNLQENCDYKSKFNISLNLASWTNYSFGYAMRNEYGLSKLSPFSTSCTTPESTPRVNPNLFCTYNSTSINEKYITIHWKDYDILDVSGMGFTYVINYKYMNLNNHCGLNIKMAKNQMSLVISNYTTNKLSIDISVFPEKCKLFKISIIAQNKNGKSNDKINDKLVFRNDKQISQNIVKFVNFAKSSAHSVILNVTYKININEGVLVRYNALMIVDTGDITLSTTLSVFTSDLYKNENVSNIISTKSFVSSNAISSKYIIYFSLKNIGKCSSPGHTTKFINQK
ncbi:hypothetical protein A3Q56_01711 [Intoshia linei]|uniref:Ig-like domain-containing protein n=1 Tax=Intoshia linei TaxID=1819745 RepID=A0A177BAH9_9BILA|nr:hypothetical protein A3Q56_01711 [Intoshia linei]